MNTFVSIVVIVTENPYKLTFLNQLSFLKTDEIARKMAIFPSMLTYLYNAYSHMKTDLLGNFQKWEVLGMA